MPIRTPTPADAADELTDHLEFLASVADARRDLARLGNVYEELTTHHRGLGICLLSEHADTAGFFQHLVQSAVTHRHLLQAIRAGASTEVFRSRASVIAPLLDAVAAKQWRLAGELADLAAQEWLPGEEYEDDFCYARCLHAFVRGKPAEVGPVAARWSAVLEGGRDPRLPVVQNLLAADDIAFADALSVLIATVEARAAADNDPVDGSLRADDPTFFPNRWVSIEGLALLAIAERHGLQVHGQFASCPPLARKSRCSGFVPAGYPFVGWDVE